MECLENGGTFCFLNVWWYLKELHLELQSTQRLERKETIPPKDVTEHYIRLEKIFRDRFPPCLQSLHCSILLCSYFQLYSPDMLAESWDWQPWGKQIDQGDSWEKISFPEHHACLAAFCVFAREARDQSLAFLGFYHQPHLIIHIQIISKKKTCQLLKTAYLKRFTKSNIQRSLQPSTFIAFKQVFPEKYYSFRSNCVTTLFQILHSSEIMKEKSSFSIVLSWQTSFLSYYTNRSPNQMDTNKEVQFFLL